MFDIVLISFVLNQVKNNWLVILQPSQIQVLQKSTHLIMGKITAGNFF